MRAMLTKALKEYKARAEKAGRSYRCLEKDGEASDALEVRAEDGTVSISGPMDGGVYGVSAEEVISELREMDADELNIIVDSPGGFLTEGMSLYAYLRERSESGTTIKTRAQGLVASAAVLPFIAGDERTMGDGSMIMVHNPWSAMIVIDDADGIEKAAALEVKALRAMQRNYAKELARRTSLTQAKAQEAMSEETWYDADEAIEHGYAQAVSDDSEAAGAGASGEVDRRVAALARNILQGYAVA